MKKLVFLFLLPLVSLPCVAQDDGAPRPPLHHFKLNPRRLTIAVDIKVLAGQEIEIENTAFSYIRLSSDQPIAVHDGSCQAVSTTDIICHTMPNLDIHFQDARIGVPYDSASLNVVHLTAIRDDPDR